MYTIDILSNTRFTTAGFIPVFANTAVQGNATPGTIDVIRIVDGGNGYSVYETGTLDSIIDNSTIRLPSTSSELDGYYVNSSIYLKSGFGSGQVREIEAYNGTTKNAIISDPVDIFTRLDFANTDFITSASVGDTVRQVVDTITFTTRVGYINPGIIVGQVSDVFATVLSANSTTLRVSRLNSSQSLSANSILVDVSSDGSLKTDKVNISNTTSLNLGIVLTPGTGYTANATVTITSNTSSNAVAIAQSNSTGKISVLTISNTGSGYITEPTIAIAAPTAQTFNANTDVTAGTGEDANNVIALATANVFVTGDQIKYSVAAGNTVIGGLSNNTTYFIQFANSTVIALSNSANTSAGNRIALTKGADETGHFFQGITATGRILPGGLYATNAAAGAIFASEYAPGSFIRIGENANANIRVIQSVNSTVIVVDRLFSNILTNANAYGIQNSILPASITVTEANGTIHDTNLDNIRLTVADQSTPGASFIIGERINTTNTVANGVGTVVFSNTTTLYLSDISGTFTSGLTVSGSSSNLSANITSVITSPNITVKNPQGTFRVGENLYFNTSTGSNTGFGQLINIVDLSKFDIEYEIAPTVKIEGDGTGAIAVATVNTQISNTINHITVLHPGSNYTEATISISANSLYGSGASAYPVISPIGGHGSDPVGELGSRYACLDMNFDTLANENWYYPTSVSFRKFGIIKEPYFANIIFETSDYKSRRLEISNNSNAWQIGELVTQLTSNAAGFVVTGNSTVVRLRDTIGTFTAPYQIYGYTSGATANVNTVSTIGFSANQVLYQPTTNATAVVVSVEGGTKLNLTNIRGKFSANVRLSCTTSCATAQIDDILRSSDELEVTNFFTRKFNQTARLTLASNTDSFTQFEYITQNSTNATGRVIATSTDLDLEVSVTNGSFTIGDSIVNSNTSANAKVSFANSTYLKLTAVSNTNQFLIGNEINNTLGGIADISNVHPVVILSDVSYNQKFQAGANQIVGANSLKSGVILSIVYPDLIRETGKVVYSESSNTVITKDINTTERVRVIIKF